VNLLFQNNYFPEEQDIWEKHNATIINGLCPEKIIKEFSPVVARGTVAFDRSVKQSLKYNGWPDIMWPFNNDWKVYNYDYLLNCSDIFNYDAKVVKIDEFSGEWAMEEVSKGFPKSKYWIRSNTGSKQFSGGVFDLDEFLLESEYLKQKNLYIELVAAKPKTLKQEWRCVIINHMVISTSQYMNNGEPEIKSFTETPIEVINFAEYWVKKHMFMFPDSYVLDVCDMGGQSTDCGGGYEYDLYVMEVNNLTTSGYYECDIERIVDEIVNQLQQI
jgi:ATP-grasp domain, R2K clade family 2